MSANRRHRRGVVLRGRPFWRRLARRPWPTTRIAKPATSLVEALREERRLRGANVQSLFRNDSDRTIYAGEMVFLSGTGGILPFPLEPPLTPASMPYSWVNPNGEVVRIYRE